jgi:peptidyl-prolyl cis-trans isomerase SurA
MKIIFSAPAVLVKCGFAALALSLASGTGAVFAQADKLTPALTGKPRERVILADRIVAVVNDEIVTLRELEERIRIVTGQLRRQNVELPPADVLQTQVLERVIVDRAQVQFARDNAIRIDDVQLDRAVARIAEENGLSPVQFRDALEKDGIPFNRFREDIRIEILINRLRQSEIDGKVVIPEGEIDNFLAQNKPSETAQEINLGHILVRVPENASPEQIEARRRRAQEALAQIKSGTDFARVAVSFSEAPEALTGGAIGFRKQENLPQLFVDAIAGLSKGGVSEPVKSANGFHIIKLIDQRGAGSAPVVKQTRVRHILLRPSEILTQDQARRRLADLRERIVNKAASFEDLARQNSVDGSASKGGDLGVVYAGDTVPEFERAMDELKIGEISQPVQTQFGWHLIEVTERSDAELSTERQRKAAREALRERKVDEAYQEWLRQLRDRIFVEYRLEDR